jgi:hypothetical protein
MIDHVSHRFAFAIAVFAGAALVTTTTACSSSTADGPAVGDASGTSGTEDAASCPAPGGAVSGPVDQHCTLDGSAIVRMVNEAACHPAADAMTSAAEADAAPADNQAEPAAPMFNAEGDDDDCKYHLRWSLTPVCQNGDVFFTLAITQKSDGAPLTGADIDLDVTLNDTHPAPNTGSSATEGPAGTYRIGPLRFDAPGEWVVRFHLNELCADLLESPHAHAGFYVSVP